MFADSFLSIRSSVNHAVPFGLMTCKLWTIKRFQWLTSMQNSTTISKHLW